MKKEIHRAFIKVWGNTPFDNMRVTTFCKQVPMARSTFYIYYDGLAMLKEEVEDDLIAALIEQNKPLFNKPITKIADIAFVDLTLAFVEEHREAFKAFLVSQPNLSFIEKWKLAIRKHFALLMTKNHMKHDDLLLDILAAGVVAAITHHLKKPTNPTSSEEISRLIFKLLD